MLVLHIHAHAWTQFVYVRSDSHLYMNTSAHTRLAIENRSPKIPNRKHSHTQAKNPTFWKPKTKILLLNPQTQIKTYEDSQYTQPKSKPTTKI